VITIINVVPFFVLVFRRHAGGDAEGGEADAGKRAARGSTHALRPVPQPASEQRPWCRMYGWTVRREFAVQLRGLRVFKGRERRARPDGVLPHADWMVVPRQEGHQRAEGRRLQQHGRLRDAGP